MPTLESIARLLAERNAYPPDDPDWIWRNNAAWRLLDIALGGPV